MKKNVGTLDTIIRLLIAVLIGVLYLFDIISGTSAVILLIIALAMLVTGLVGWCGFYSLLGISTCKTAKKE